ncbi:MAG: cysteine--tRNA ligase [Candidatus Omnitrophica bacterium]|nr:cysteine--tRNA ligase [Candidatus Omnitrophota bacterium]
MIKFFNTFSAKLEEFKSLAEGQVKMYTCGPTVYDDAHIGNFRAFVFEDLLRRFLEYKGFKVIHVMNVTDVDDKTIAGANKNVEARSPRPMGGETSPLQRLHEFTQKYIDAFNEDLKILNILPPTKQPHATLHVPIMIDLIQKLIEKKAAYVSDGSVYYRVDSFKNYGKLSKKDLEKNIKGARVDLDEYEKEEGSDFALWKKAREGEPTWDSPWGLGRPGWHIECSAMSMKYLGETFDIHAGGEDLIFPHHENEIAQSEGATGKQFVRFWLHCKHLLVNGEKMSKSKGNYFTLRDLLQRGYDPIAIRYALLSVHYRQQLNFTLEGLGEASEVIKKLDDCLNQCITQKEFQKEKTVSPLKQVLDEKLDRIVKPLEDDLNVSAAFANLFDAVKSINSYLKANPNDGAGEGMVINFFDHVDRLFGFDIVPSERPSPEIIRILIEYENLRKSRDFSRSDSMRKQIEKYGWLVKDGRPGEPSTLKKKRRVWDQ